MKHTDLTPIARHYLICALWSSTDEDGRPLATKTRKFTYLWVVQQYFRPYGWEDVSASEAWKEAREDVKAYRQNQPEYPARVIRRRELNPTN